MGDAPEPHDWTAAARWLAAAGHRLALEPAPERLSGGLANLNWRVWLDGRPAVFRRPPAGELAAGASDMGREATVLTGLAPAFPLAPRLIAACLERDVIGVPFLLIEWREGVAVGGTLPPGFAPDAHRWLLPALAGALARLHALNPVALGLGQLGRATGFAERTLRGWTKRAAVAFGSAAPPALGQLLEQLERRLPADAPARLLHMDAKLDNLLVDPKACAATALIDWDMGTLGPPAFDLAVLLSYWIEADDPPDTQMLGAVPSLRPGWPGRDGVVAAYAEAAGGVPPDLGWHLALARLRLSTAWMQLYRLWERGSLTGDRYARFDSIARAILAQAVDRFGDV